MKKCPKFGTQMNEGLITDNAYNISVKAVKWAERIKKIFKWGVDYINQKDIKAYNCTKCKFIELYTA